MRPNSRSHVCATSSRAHRDSYSARCTRSAACTDGSQPASAAIPRWGERPIILRRVTDFASKRFGFGCLMLEATLQGFCIGTSVLEGVLSEATRPRMAAKCPLRPEQHGETAI